jgi:hypothetical protein
MTCHEGDTRCPIAGLDLNLDRNHFSFDPFMLYEICSDFCYDVSTKS